MRKILTGALTGLVVATATAVPAVTANAAAGESITLLSTTGIGYGDPDPDMDGGLADFAYRPHMTLQTEVRCTAGRMAVAGFTPTTGMQAPRGEPFRCTGARQRVPITPAAYEQGPVEVTTALYYEDSGGNASATDSGIVDVVDVRAYTASLRGPATVARGQRVTLTGEVTMLSQRRWGPARNTPVLVLFNNGNRWQKVGEAVSNRNGRVTYTSSPMTRSGTFALSLPFGTRTYSSDGVEVEVTAPPAAPTAWIGKVTGTTADLHWTAPKGVEGITGYRFGWTSSNGKPVPSWSGDWPATARSPLTMINLHPGATYTMWVQTITRQGVSAKATVKVTTTRPAPPKLVAPSVPRAVTATAGSRRVAVRWAPPAKNGGAAVTRYQVRLTAPGVNQVHTVAPTRRAMTVHGLTKGKTYVVQTRARNSAAWSGWSARLTVRVR